MISFFFSGPNDRAFSILHHHHQFKTKGLLLESNDPREAICNAATEHHIDILVVGTRGLGTIKKYVCALFLAASELYALLMVAVLPNNNHQTDLGLCEQLLHSARLM